MGLADRVSLKEACDLAYATELAEIVADLQRGLPVLIECDKELTGFLYASIRDRLKPLDLKCTYLDGRLADETGSLERTGGQVAAMIRQLQESVRGAIERKVVVLPHLDLLTTSQGGLTSEAREVIPLLYENPELVWLGFKDPSFGLPAVIENLFVKRKSILGVPRHRLEHLVTRSEARKFGRKFHPNRLYKYVSGLNAIRLRRVLSTLDTQDHPDDPTPAFRQIREATRLGQLEIPEVDLHRDIGGYAEVKRRLQEEVLDFLALRDQQPSQDALQRVERLIPRGLVFWGPPGTGKTLIAKALATAIGAAVNVVSGPELKSRWVGESEAQLRQVFYRARQSAPALIIFDELDAFASARGTYRGSGVEHSMVNQLLTELDGFRTDELVFVVGTTNLVELIDPALLRPGRFEFVIEIPYPDADSRREILQISDRRYELQMSDDCLAMAVDHTACPESADSTRMRFSGDHLDALCRAIARHRLRHQLTDATTPELFQTVFQDWSACLGAGD